MAYTDAPPCMSPTDENALVACDVAVETAEARAAEAEGLAQRYLLERDELLQARVEAEAEAEAEARRGRKEVTEVVGAVPSPGIKAGRAVSKQRPPSRPRASVESAQAVASISSRGSCRGTLHPLVH